MALLLSQPRNRAVGSTTGIAKRVILHLNADEPGGTRRLVTPVLSLRRPRQVSPRPRTVRARGCPDGRFRETEGTLRQSRPSCRTFARTRKHCGGSHASDRSSKRPAGCRWLRSLLIFTKTSTEPGLIGPGHSHFTGCAGAVAAAASAGSSQSLLSARRDNGCASEPMPCAEPSSTLFLTAFAEIPSSPTSPAELPLHRPSAVPPSSWPGGAGGQ